MPSLSQSSPREPSHDEFLALLEAHQRLVLKVCWSYTRTTHDRDDLFQEIVARLWAAFPSYDRSRPFSTWMYRVALNVAIDSQRRRRRSPASMIGLDSANDPPSPHDDSKLTQLTDLRELLERQTEADRALLLLALEGNSYREIAEIIGISESNVGTRLSRIKNSLRLSVLASQS